MPANTSPEREEFSLEGIGALAEKAGLDLNEQSGDPAGGRAAADDAAREQLEGAPAEETEQPGEGEHKADGEQEGNEGTEEAAAGDAASADEGEATAGEAAVAGGAEAEEAAAKDGAGADNPNRDVDDLVKQAIEPHTRPKTRKVITSLQREVHTARADAVKLRAEKAGIEEQLTAARAQPGSGPDFERIKQENEQLRERVRELDISQDPQVVGQFDRKIGSNTKLVLDTLAKYKAEPEVVERLKREGLSLKNLKPFLDKMIDNGEEEDAEMVKGAVLENARLGRDRQTAVQEAKTGYEQTVATRKAQRDQEAETQEQEVTKEGARFYNADLEVLKKDLPFLVKPEAPKPNDPPQVVAAKNKAISDWNAFDKEIRSEVVRFSTKGKTGKDEIAARALTFASAIQGVVLKKIALPRLVRSLKASQERVKALETDLAKFRKSGRINGAQAAAASVPGKKDDLAPASVSTEDAMTNFARRQGLQA